MSPTWDVELRRLTSLVLTLGMLGLGLALNLLVDTPARWIAAKLRRT